MMTSSNTTVLSCSKSSHYICSHIYFCVS